MSILNVVTLLGGLAFFLYGMTIMGNGLEKISGGRLERILEKLTSKVIFGVMVGALVTGVIQSSSATTVMVIGFVNAGIMSLNQAVGVIMGANIGTTVTAQILRFGDISSDTLLLQMLKPTNLSPIIAIIGVCLFMFVKSGRKHDVGQILLGFALLFSGMNIMETAVRPLQDVPEFTNLFTAFTNPVLGILVGTAVTALIQSSSASVGILQALSVTGVIPFSAAAPIILGQNIGTTVTALLSSIGASRNARRAALIHLYFNLIGAAVFITILYAIKNFLPFWDDPVNRGSIANFHLIFNLGSTLLLFPFSSQLVKLAKKSVKRRADDEEDPEIEVLDPRFLASPSVALERAHETVIQIAKLAQSNLSRANSLLKQFDERKHARLMDSEDVIDRSEAKLGHYLISLTERDLTVMESAIQSELLHSINDFERIGDYAVNLADSAVAYNSQPNFTRHAGIEMDLMFQAVQDILALSLDAYMTKDCTKAALIEPFEEVIDTMTDYIREQHIDRLKRGECSAETGAVFIEMLLDLERVADHCSNLGVNIIATYGPAMENFNSHEYKRHLHQKNTLAYNQQYAEYEEIYLKPLKVAGA